EGGCGAHGGGDEIRPGRDECYPVLLYNTGLDSGVKGGDGRARSGPRRRSSSMSATWLARAESTSRRRVASAVVAVSCSWSASRHSAAGAGGAVSPSIR